MNKIILILTTVFFLTGGALFAQTPQAFKYQAIVRDNSGNILANKNVSFRIGILHGSASGASSYSETQTATSNQFGLVNLNIGDGSVASGTFSAISWGTDTYFVKIEFDPAGGTSYQLMGTSQLLSVPYSLYSQKAGNGGDTSNTNELQTLTQSGTNVTLSKGGGTISINDGDTALWKKNGTSISYASGKVGIGTSILGGYELTLNGVMEFNGTATPGFILTPNASATKSGTIFQSSDQLIFGASGVGNIGSIDLTAPASSFSFGSDGGLNLSHPLTLQSGAPLQIYTTDNSHFATFQMQPSGSFLNENYTLNVTNGDVYVSNSTKGIILVSSGGQCYRVTVNNAGTLVSTAIVCPQ